MDESTPYATNDEIAHVLFKVASVLDLLHENPFRARAYRRVALQVLMLPEPLVLYLTEDEEAPLHGVGERMRAHLMDLVNSGHLGVYESLMEELGEPLASLVGLYGVGPKTALRLVRELRVQSIEDLLTAAREGKIRQLKGFGPKRESAILSQVESRVAGAA